MFPQERKTASVLQGAVGEALVRIAYCLRYYVRFNVFILKSTFSQSAPELGSTHSVEVSVVLQTIFRRFCALTSRRKFGELVRTSPTNTNFLSP